MDKILQLDYYVFTILSVSQTLESISIPDSF